MDFSALDEELFGDTSSGDENNAIMPTQNLDFSLGRHNAATSEYPDTSGGEIERTSRSSHCIRPRLLRRAHDSPSENEQLLGSILLDPEIVPRVASNSDRVELVAGNVLWMKTRITDAHQLLLHYLNLREAHQSLTTDLQKEVVLRTETQEALERIREQQDQSSEDIPKLQFQIAQLKLDYQKERAARAAADSSLAEVKERNQAHLAAYTLLQSRLTEFNSKEKQWHEEKGELTNLIQDLLKENGSNRPQQLPLDLALLPGDGGGE